MAAQGGQPEADKKAPEELAAEKAAAEKAAAAKAEAKTAAAAKAADATADGDGEKPKSKAKQYTVVGAAAVMAGDDGSERYLYKGASFDSSSFSAENIEHNLSVGLIEKVK